MNESMMEQLRTLRLYGIVAGLKEQEESTEYQALSFNDRLTFLIEKEFLRRKNNRVKDNIRRANLRLSASLADLDFSVERNLNKKQILDLANCNWITKKENLIITGATGAGKSYLSCVFGHQFCSQGNKSLYLKTSEIVSRLSLARASGKFFEELARLSKVPLLIIDEWLREELKEQACVDILDLIDERHNKASIIFCSQLSVSDWHKNIGIPTVADAILDRIVFSSHRIEIKGKSMRQKNSLINTQYQG